MYLDGGKKQLPFRRQRMDIDSLIPLSKEAKTLNNENYCCSIARIWEKANMKNIPETYNLLEIATKRCEELENQMHNLEEELQLNERKVENFRQQVILRDSEIERLRSITELGRSLEAIMHDSTEKQSDRLIQQLQIQVDLLQTRNAELESRIVELVNREIPIVQPSSISLIHKECQTMPLCKPILVNNLCQTNSMDAVILNESDMNSIVVEFKRKICNLIEKFENGRVILTHRLHSINIQNRKLTNELSNYIRSSLSSVRNRLLTRAGKQMIKLIEKYLHDIEENRNRCQSEIETVAYNLKCISNYFHEKYFEFTTKQLTDDKNTMKLGLELQCQRSKAAERNIDQHQDCKNGLQDDEMKCLRQERDDLIGLLDYFERQLHDIKENLQLVIHERDSLKHELSVQSEQLNKLNCFHQSMPLNQCTTNHSHSSGQHINKVAMTAEAAATAAVRNSNRELDELIQNLQSMTTERNVLHERLHNLTVECANENSQFVQRLENSKNELNAMKENKIQLEQRVTELLKLVVEKETELNRLIEKLNCLDKEQQSNTEQFTLVEKNLQTVQAQLENVQRDYEKSRNDYTSLHVTLRQIDQEKDHLQICLDERTEHCSMLERQLVTYETSIKDLKMNNETSDKQIQRLKQSIIERESENRELIERLSKSECDLKSTVKNHELLMKDLENTKNQLNILTNETQRLQSELDASYDKQNELDKRLIECDKELTNLRNSNSMKEQERIKLLKQYRTIALKLDEKTTLVDRLDNQLKEFNYKYSELDKESIDLRQQLQQQKKDCHDYAQVVKSLEVQSELLKKTISDSEDRIKRLQMENEEIHRDLIDTRNLCDNLERQKNSLQHQTTISSLEVNQLKAKIIETERELMDCRKELDRERESMRNFELILGSSREAEHTANHELKECHAELCSLRERLTVTETKLFKSKSEMKTLLQKQLALLQNSSENCYSSLIKNAEQSVDSLSDDRFVEKHLQNDVVVVQKITSPTTLSMELLPLIDDSTKELSSSSIPCSK
ncbi:unnamed protein product [Schistosoma turkestanicum]|nr:unnamed protein product [Schistosoma turkestanicum]